MTITFNPAKNILTLLQETVSAAMLQGWDTSTPLVLPFSELKCWSYENVPLTWLDETAAANESTADDMNLPLKNAASPYQDAYYWGNVNAMFDRITIIITRAGVGNWTTSNMIFEYSTATGWASCNPYTTDTSNRFKNAGMHTITFYLPGFAMNWAKRAAGPTGSQITAYWIRVRFTATSATVTTAPKAGQCWLSVSFSYVVTGKSHFQPLDWYDMEVTITITSFTSSGTIDITGTDRLGNPVTENFAITSTGSYTTTNKFTSLNSPDGIKVTGRFDYEIVFPRHGLIGKIGTSQYYFLCQFVLGDGTLGNASIWTDGDPDLVSYHFPAEAEGDDENLIWVMGNSSLRFGACLDETHKVTEGGVAFINQTNRRILGDIDSDVRLYNTHFHGTSPLPVLLKGTVQRVWDCLVRETYLLVTNGDVSRLRCYSGYPLYQQVSGVFDNITAIGCFCLALLQSAGTVNIQNFYVRNTIRQNPDQTVIISQVNDRVVNLDDGDCDVWNMDADISQTSTINRRHSFDATVKDKKTKTPIQGATITLYDKDGNQLFALTTDINGQIVTQKVIHSDWKWINSAGVKTSPDNLYSPFRVTVEAKGYQIYDNPNITLDKATRVEIGLTKVVDVIFVDGKPALSLDETNQSNQLFIQV